MGFYLKDAEIIIEIAPMTAVSSYMKDKENNQVARTCNLDHAYLQIVYSTMMSVTRAIQLEWLDANEWEKKWKWPLRN